MLHIVFLRLSLFIQGTCINHMLKCQMDGSLMDGKNLITEAQVVKALFALQILDSIQPLLHQHC